MADPISVRHIMATSEIADRIAKTAAATNNQTDDQFQKAMARQEALKQTQVNENEDSKGVDNEEQKKERQERERAAKQKEDQDPNQDTGEVAAAPSDHIIDLQV